jgi:HD superfamily phosphohydrolase
MSAFETLISACRERWARGAADFAKLHTANPGRLPAEKTVRSAIYGNMEFGKEEMRFIESFYLQRLRNVSQMGLLNLVYPDARHSRFEHSLGVLFSLKSLLTADRKVKDALSERERRTLFFAAILHDCGHGPFSHTTESLLKLSGLDLEMRPKEAGEEGVKPHERRCRDMIRDTDFHLRNLGIPSYGLKAALAQFDVDPEAVVDTIRGKKPSLLLNLLSGDFDVDKMDYFRRDAFFTGTTGGGVDMEAIQRWVRIVEREGYKTASYDSRLVGHLLHLLYSREHVYNVTAFHPVARIAAALVLVAGDLVLRALEPAAAAQIFANLELFDDRELLSIIETASREQARDRAEAIILERVVQRLYLRRLPKRLATLSRSEFSSIFAACADSLEKETGSLPELAYCRLSAIAGGKYLKLLPNGEDDIAILEMSPKLGSSGLGNEACEQETRTLDGILISHNGLPVKLSEWLDRTAGAGASAAHAKALRAYKLSIWRALVVVPAALRLNLREKALEPEFLRDFAAALADTNVRRPFGKTRAAWSDALNEVGAALKIWRH